MGTDPLVLAGDAAEILEQMGMVACGRRRSGVVTIECWVQASGQRYFLRQEVRDPTISAQALAETCALKLRAELARGEG
jgi:hypothetical protein